MNTETQNQRPTPAQTRRRDETRRHYNRYPFDYDNPDRDLLLRKLAGSMIGEFVTSPARLAGLNLDVGCSIGRLAGLMRHHHGAGLRVVGLDMNCVALERAARHMPVGQADCSHLPLRDGCAETVYSTGVIHVTPDPRRSFAELVRVTKPGGSLLLSVYNRRNVYYLEYRSFGALVRALQGSAAGRAVVNAVLIPLWYLFYLQLGRLLFTRLEWEPWRQVRNFFHDQYTTPHLSFHSFEEIEAWGAEEGLRCEARETDLVGRMLYFLFCKPG